MFHGVYLILWVWVCIQIFYFIEHNIQYDLYLAYNYFKLKVKFNQWSDLNDFSYSKWL
jgi:hypothetical protein